MIESYRDYMHYELRMLCNDMKVDRVTRRIAYGLFKTNHQAAMDYVKGFPKREAVRLNQIK